MQQQTPHQRAIGQLRPAFEAFIRTGVWGTCVDCPHVDGKKVPELCRNAQRYDHQLTPESLFKQYQAYVHDAPAMKDKPGVYIIRNGDGCEVARVTADCKEIALSTYAISVSVPSDRLREIGWRAERVARL